MRNTTMSAHARHDRHRYAGTSMATRVKGKLTRAATTLHVPNPVPVMNGMLDRTFSLPDDDAASAESALAPAAVPFQPSFCESEPTVLRFTTEPLGPHV